MTWMNELKEGDLDDIVHDAASAMASNANNEGPSGQVAFLLAVCGWTEEEVKEQVEARRLSPEDQAKVDKLVVKTVAAIQSWEEKVLAEKAAEIAEQAIEELPKQSSMGEMALPDDEPEEHPSPFGGSHAPDCPYRFHGECNCWRSDPDQNPEA